MALRVTQTKREITSGHDLPLSKRFFLLLLICSIQLIYIPTSNRLFGGFEPKLPIDTFPIWTVWVVPYVLCYPLWLAAIAWAIFKMDDRLLRSMAAAFLLTCTISVSIFVFFPTYVKADIFYGSDIFTVLLRFIHRNAGRYDAFPSGHIYITVLLALFYSRWYPRYKAWWILIPVLVSFSTLFTHQHYIVDILGGLVVALLGYHFGLRWAGIPPIRLRNAKRQTIAD